MTPSVDADDSFVAGTDAYARRLRAMQGCVRTLLKGVGEDPDREGLRDTPKVSSVGWWRRIALGAVSRG